MTEREFAIIGAKIVRDNALKQVVEAKTFLRGLKKKFVVKVEKKAAKKRKKYVLSAEGKKAKLRNLKKAWKVQHEAIKLRKAAKRAVSN